MERGSPEALGGRGQFRVNLTRGKSFLETLWRRTLRDRNGRDKSCFLQNNPHIGFSSQNFQELGFSFPSTQLRTNFPKEVFKKLFSSYTFCQNFSKILKFHLDASSPLSSLHKGDTKHYTCYVYIFTTNIIFKTDFNLIIKKTGFQSNYDWRKGNMATQK